MTELRINEQIAFLRKQKGVTQEELAKALGVTNQAVSKWESGTCCPDLQLLPDLAAYFGVSADELLGYKPAETLGNLYLDVKKLFQALPEKEAISTAFKLATLLHECAVSGGYKKHLPWNPDKEYGLKTEPYKWGCSICSEPEGATMHIGNGIFFADHKYWQEIKPADIRDIYFSLEALCDMDCLRVMYAVFELTAHDFELYVPADEIAEKARLSKDAVAEALDRLPVKVKDDSDGRALYRIEGSAMHLPSLLLMLRKT